MGISDSTLRNADFVSLSQVQVNNSWGQYGICYQGYCNGGNNYSVGRAASFRVKELEGQCTDNSDTGSWFSLTSGARCTGEIGTNNCAWKEISRETTITVECLNQRGFSTA